ncbi:hypothetical protein FQA39_LY16734 [Lamprigera yunnana]|nr:hypothetical protein FQA39_LY16734 [Lamprigera yunnana]
MDVIINLMKSPDTSNCEADSDTNIFQNLEARSLITGRFHKMKKKKIAVKKSSSSDSCINTTLEICSVVYFAGYVDWGLQNNALNQTIYYLNKSKSKCISIRLYYPFEFASVVKIFGSSKRYVTFKEKEWIQFNKQQKNINKYFQTCDMMWKPRQIGSKTLTYEMIEEKKILRIQNKCGNEVYLGYESVSEKYSLLKKMWVLYAEQHWTKVINLKSAIERLYEKLSALEFDEDPEAIYGMEKYYTVEQC